MPASNESVRHREAYHGLFGLVRGTAVMVGATIAAAALFPVSQTIARLVMVAVAVGWCAATLADTRVSLALTALGYLLFTGLLVDSGGGLSQEEGGTLSHLIVILMAFGLGLGQRWIRAVDDDPAFDAELRQLLKGAEPGQNEDRDPPDR